MAADYEGPAVAWFRGRWPAFVVPGVTPDDGLAAVISEATDKLGQAYLWCHLHRRAWSPDSDKPTPCGCVEAVRRFRAANHLD